LEFAATSLQNQEDIVCKNGRGVHCSSAIHGSDDEYMENGHGRDHHGSKHLNGHSHGHHHHHHDHNHHHGHNHNHSHENGHNHNHSHDNGHNHNHSHDDGEGPFESCNHDCDSDTASLSQSNVSLVKFKESEHLDSADPLSSSTIGKVEQKVRSMNLWAVFVHCLADSVMSLVVASVGLMVIAFGDPDRM
jgi:hypothetical protein